MEFPFSQLWCTCTTPVPEVDDYTVLQKQIEYFHRKSLVMEQIKEMNKLQRFKSRVSIMIPNCWNCMRLNATRKR